MADSTLTALTSSPEDDLLDYIPPELYGYQLCLGRSTADEDEVADDPLTRWYKYHRPMYLSRATATDIVDYYGLDDSGRGKRGT